MISADSLVDGLVDGVTLALLAREYEMFVLVYWVQNASVVMKSTNIKDVVAEVMTSACGESLVFELKDGVLLGEGEEEKVVITGTTDEECAAIADVYVKIQAEEDRLGWIAEEDEDTQHDVLGQRYVNYIRVDG
jgi:hypothetical protein